MQKIDSILNEYLILKIIEIRKDIDLTQLKSMPLNSKIELWKSLMTNGNQ